MRRRALASLPEDMDADDLEPIVAVLVQAYPKVTRDQCYRWLLGDRAVDENARVLLDAARRASRLRVAAQLVKADIRAGRFDAPPPICWRAA